MIHAFIGSQNPVKINSVQLGFTKMFPDLEFSFQGIGVDSGVSNQPLSEEETIDEALAILRQEFE